MSFNLPPLPAVRPKLPPLPPRKPEPPPTCRHCNGALDRNNTSRLLDGTWKHIGCRGSAIVSATPAVASATPTPTPTPTLYADCAPARVLVADPPWAFADRTPHKGAEDHYKVLSLDEIKAFPLPPLLDNAVLFLWRVGAGNEKDGSLGEEAYGVVRAWGFTPKSEIAWRKTLICKKCEGKGWGPVVHPAEAIVEACASIRVWCEECKGRGYRVACGMGRYVRGAHEICLIATRGKAMPEAKDIRSVFDSPRGEHSEKPARFYEIVEQLYPKGPYTELFARRRREGWQCFGDELGTST